ncbi:MAG: MFS transporter [Actinobacteria bacterium]|nr:MFS transporter [Actinomycetota bacterium]
MRQTLAVQRSESRDIRLLFPLPLATIASQSSMASVPPLFVAISHEYGVSIGTVGQVRGVSAASAVVGTLLVGGWIHRHGARPVMVWGGLLAAVGALICATAPAFAMLAVGQVVVGAGICCLLSSGFAGAGEFFAPGARDWAVGWITALQSLAWIIGVPLVGLIADQVGWRAAFAVPAAFALIAAFSAMLFAPKIERDPDGPDERTGLLAALADPSARRWTVGELLAFAVWTGEITYIAAFYMETYGISEGLVGVLLPTGSMAFFAGSALAERVGRGWSRRRLLAASAVAMGAVACVLFNFHPAVPVTMAIGLLIGVAAGLRAASSSALALNQLPDKPGAMMAARTAAVQIGYLVGASIGGVAVDAAGYGSLGVIMITGMALSALVMSGVRERPPTVVSQTAD